MWWICRRYWDQARQELVRLQDTLKNTNSRLTHILAATDALRLGLQQLTFMARRPGPLHVVIMETQGMAIRFAVVLPERPDNDWDWNEIAAGELTVKIPGRRAFALATTKEMQLTEERLVDHAALIGRQGDLVELAFLYLDDAGNRGAPSTATAELADTVPPVTPGLLGVVATHEVPDDELPPDDEEDEEPTE